MARRKQSNRIRRWRRRLRRFIVHDILHADDPPHRLALGIALGVFFAFIPVFGAQMILVVLSAWLLRANKLVGTPIVWLTNPATVVPIYYTCYLLGIRILRMPNVGLKWWAQLAEPPHGWSVSLAFYWSRLFEVAAPLLLGSLIVAVAAAVPAYLVTYRVIWTYRMRRWGRLTLPGEDPAN